MRKRELIFWICSAGALFLIHLVAGYIILAKRMIQASPILGLLFCLISCICLYGLCIHPLLKAFFRPRIGSHPIGDDTKARLKQQVRESAKSVLILTTLSHNNIIDFFTNFYICYSMIGQLVQEAGYRPSIIQLLSLYRTVLKNAFLVASADEIIDNIDVPELLTKAGAHTLCKILKPIGNGLSYSYLCLRIGYNAIKFLECGRKQYIDKSSSIRKNIAKEARKDLGGIVKMVFKKGEK